ncbi:hypothetical protein DY000_02055439 [Brassica cretica]|uniref:Ubiquitin-like protease family profile domain-containing protein n=1 Tax=Brassica cretica TaxID=69181 RepID=A0ABQ7AA09_BRACR|nr:hypothetical protein DY000_02055439 [Brassica cretica]
MQVLNGAQEIQSSIHTEYQTLRGGAQKSGAEDMVASNPSASLVVDNPPPQYPLGRAGKVADHRQSSPDMNLDPELLLTKPTFSLRLTQKERPHRKETVTEGVSMCENDVDHSQSSPDTNLDHELPFPKPTFSLGLTQEERPHPKEAVTEGETMCENAAGKEICEQEDQLGACRKSKRLKALPKSLVGQYECDMRLLNRARVAFVDPDNTGGNIDYAAKFSSLLDKLKSPFFCTKMLEHFPLRDLVAFRKILFMLTLRCQPFFSCKLTPSQVSTCKCITPDKIGSEVEKLAVSNSSASLVVDNPPPQYPLGREGKVADHRQSSPDMNLDHELLFTKPTFSLRLTQEEHPHWKDTVTEGVSMSENDVDHSQSSPDTNLDHELPFPKPTVSLGLTQEERPHPKEAVTEGETMCENAVGKEICEQEDQLGVCRKSKRLKALPKSLVGQYECDMRILNRARVAFDPDNTCGNIDYAAKFSSLDKLKSPFTIRIGQSTLESNDLYELVQRSSPLQPKVRSSALQYVQERVPSGFPAIYLSEFEVIPTLSVTIFPSISKKHWVGVCVDCTSWSIVVMDCNIALRTDSMMVKEVTPIAQMFPYLLKQGGKQLLHKDARAFSIERPRSIPQNTFHADSAVSALLLVQAHAVAGLDVCKCITPDKISSEVEKLAVRPRSIPQNTFHADSAVSALLLVQAHAVAGVDVCKCITPDKIGSEVERLAVMFYEATVGIL